NCFAGSALDPPDHASAQASLCLCGIRLTHDDRHSNSHVENLIHFGAINVSFLADKFEDRRYVPGTRFDYGIAIFRKNAGQIINQSAAGDVREPVNHHSWDFGE